MGVRHGDGAVEDLAGGAVDGDQVALVDDAATADAEQPALGVDIEVLCATHTSAAHTAGDHGGV